MRYAQVKGGQKLHLVYEAGEGPDPQHLIPAGQLSRPLCNRPNANNYRMSINVPMGALCKNCRRVSLARQRRRVHERIRTATL